MAVSSTGFVTLDNLGQRLELPLTGARKRDPKRSKVDGALGVDLMVLFEFDGCPQGNREWDTVHVITEHALLPVMPGREDEFEIAFAEARAIITSMPGCRGLSLSRSIESPSTYLLLVEWEQLEDHTIGFRQSEQYQAWRALLHHFYEPFPLVDHYRSVP